MMGKKTKNKLCGLWWCERELYAAGVCATHYNTLLKYHSIFGPGKWDVVVVLRKYYSLVRACQMLIDIVSEKETMTEEERLVITEISNIISSTTGNRSTGDITKFLDEYEY